MAESKEPAKRSLGRGLGSLLGDDVFENFTVTGPVATPTILNPPQTIPDTQRIWSIDIEKLTGNVYQPRKLFAPDKLQELSASIKEKGILQPIVARRIDSDHFEIIAG